MTGRRIGAAFLDIGLFIPVFLLFARLFGEFGSTDGDGFSANLTGIPFVVFFVTYLAYFGVTEKLFGASVGKKMSSLRVVSEDGSPITWGQTAVRTLGRLIDIIPAFYVVGFVCAAVTKKHQRLGDLMAKTIVVSA